MKLPLFSIAGVAALFCLLGNLRADEHSHGPLDGAADREGRWSAELAQMSAEDIKNLGRVTGVLDSDLWQALTPGRKRQ